MHQTVTRADLCESVHESLGLSRQECAGLVERTLELMVEALERGETFVESFQSVTVLFADIVQVCDTKGAGRHSATEQYSRQGLWPAQRCGALWDVC